jgi:hypothetical protein
MPARSGPSASRAHSARGRTAAGLPVELDVGHAALLVEQRVRVHAKALHVAVVGRDADVVLQERELRAARHTL